MDGDWSGHPSWNKNPPPIRSLTPARGQTTTTPMKSILLAFLCLASACGSNSSSPATSPTNETEVAPERPEEATPSRAACEAATECGACQDIEGCYWTPDGCSVSCLMDTWCVTPDDVCPAVPEGLVGAWQEDQSRSRQNARVFVSADEDLGPSRFRQTYTFRADGTADVGVLAPNDAHYSAAGTWTLAPGAELRVAYETREGEQRAESWTMVVSEGTLTLTTNDDTNW